MKTETTFYKFLLTSKKQLMSHYIDPYQFQLVHHLFLQVFGLSDHFTDDFEYDRYTLVPKITEKVYNDVYRDKLDCICDTIPYSFINLYAFFSHIFINRDDHYLIGLYKKQDNIAVIGNYRVQESISYLFLDNKQVIYDTPLLNVYAFDFYPNYKFTSDDEKEHLIYHPIDYSDDFDCFVTISSNHYLVSKDEYGSFVAIPTFDDKLREYLYLKYLQLYHAFLVLYESKKYELRILSPEEEIPNQYGISPASRKRSQLGDYDDIHRYLNELVDFFSPPS